MQECKRVGAALAALAFSAAVGAQGTASGESIASKLYVGAGYGQAHWRPGCPGTVASCDDTDASVRVFAGYQINRTFAGEIGFTNLGKAVGPNVEVKGKAWEASVLAGWPLMGSFSVFGRLGLHRGAVKGGGIFAGSNETNYGPTYGAGVQFDFSPNVGVRAEWQAYPGVGGSRITDSDVNIIGLSALWRFR